MEEDIEIIEKFLEECNKDLYGEIDIKCDGFTRNAIENILSDYKRVLKENEEWQRAYQEEKDKQFELVRENQLAKEALKKQCDIVDERNQLLRENQKLQKENEELKYKYDKALSDVITRVDLDNTYISKQKIKDKIEELKEKPLKIKVNNKYYYETDAYNKIIIQVLQDLLEEKGE